MSFIRLVLTSTARLRAQAAITIGTFMLVLGSILLAAGPVKGQVESQYQYNAVASENRFTRLETQQDQIIQGLKEVHDTQNSQQTIGQILIVLFGGNLTVSGFRLKRSINKEKEE